MALARRIEIQVDPVQRAELEALFRDTPKKVDRVLVGAINKTARWANTRVLRAITKHLSIKRKELTSHSPRYGQVFLRKATYQRQKATISVTGGRIPLIWFGARQLRGRVVRMTHLATRHTYKRRMAGGGVSYRIGRRGPRSHIRAAFIGRARAGQAASAAEHASGHVGVWRRATPQVKRLPIIQLMGPSIPHVALKMRGLRQMLDVDTHERLKKEIASQVDRFLKRSRK